MKAPSPIPADREPESHAQLAHDLAALRDAYARVAPPFVFQPADSPAARPARVVRLRVAGVGFGLLATAAGLLLAMALWQLEPPAGRVTQAPPPEPAAMADGRAAPSRRVARSTPSPATPRLVPVRSQPAAKGLAVAQPVRCSLNLLSATPAQPAAEGQLPALVPRPAGSSRSAATFSIRTPRLTLSKPASRRKPDAADQSNAVDQLDDHSLSRPVGRAANA